MDTGLGSGSEVVKFNQVVLDAPEIWLDIKRGFRCFGLSTKSACNWIFEIKTTPRNKFRVKYVYEPSTFSEN